MEQNHIDVAALAAKAARVGEIKADADAAFEASKDAEGQALAAVVAAVRPALRALCSRIPRVNRSTSGRNGCNPVSEKEWFSERGLLLVDQWEEERDYTGNEGTYGGRRLYLLDDGRFAIVDREGTWSCWQGAWSGYECSLEICSSPREVMESWEFDECTDAISKALEAHVSGNLAKRASANRARAEKLRAIVALAK